jgi:hypothetical protein
MKRDKMITEKDIYYFYPYKKNPPPTGRTIPQPYVKKKDVSDHKYSITYDVWLSIIQDYILEINALLFKGKIVKSLNFLGSFQLKKYKLTKLVNWAKTRQEGKVHYKYDSELYRIIIKWNRNYKYCKFKNAEHWKIRMNSAFAAELYQKSLDDPNYQYSIIDV